MAAQAPSSSPYDAAMSSAVSSANAQYGVSIPEGLFRQLIFSESSFNPGVGSVTANNGNSYGGMGQIGVSEIMASLGVSKSQAQQIQSDPKLYDQNLQASANYLASLVQKKGLADALAQYKGGDNYEAKTNALDVLNKSGYGNLAPWSWASIPGFSDSGSATAPDVGAAPATTGNEVKPSGLGQGTGAGTGKSAAWSTVQTYAASAAMIVVGVGLLLVIAGKDTWQSIQSKVVA
jgi:hypothetical protein